MLSPFNASRIDRISSPLIGNGYTFDLLRDDLIHPIVSGNKWRKLKYIVQFALQHQKSHLVSFGGAYSNHLVALAYAGKHFGLQTSGFVRGDEERPLNHYEELCIKNDMQLIKTSRTDYRNKQALFDAHFENDTTALFVNEGGDHPMALPGCAEILDELPLTYDIMILSMGTGTTMEGLVKAIVERNLPTKVWGISSLKNNFELDRKMSLYPGESYQIFHNYHRGKYAKSDTELITFIQNFYTETGIKTDTVYTGKMLMAVDDLIKKGEITAEQKVLCIHTGGLLAYPD